MSEVGDAGTEVWECMGAATWWVEGREGARAVRWGTGGSVGAWRLPVWFCRVKGEAQPESRPQRRDAALFFQV